jgi:hypothetical protein
MTMPKITADDIKDMGFVQEMFGKVAQTDFDTWLTKVITEQSAILSGRITATKYATTEDPTQTYIKRAEKCLVAVELYSRRFITIAEEINKADGIDAFKLRRQQEKFNEEAESLITVITAGKTSDGSGYSGGTLVTSHFDD